MVWLPAGYTDVLSEKLKYSIYQYKYLLVFKLFTYYLMYND